MPELLCLDKIFILSVIPNNPLPYGLVCRVRSKTCFSLEPLQHKCHPTVTLDVMSSSTALDQCRRVSPPRDDHAVEQRSTKRQSSVRLQIPVA